MPGMERAVPRPGQQFCSALLPPERSPVLIVVESGETLTAALEELCAFLGIGVLQVRDPAPPLTRLLVRHQPIAVVAELEGEAQDGCHVLMTVARFDPTLPVLMVAGEEPHLLGAVDAVQELWGLTAVTTTSALPRGGALVEYLFRAGRRAGIGRLLPV
ncbi:MAG: hypothetical protein J0H67_22405 [Rhodospirillales bacterium]|nr:hypothetical protein [Rhodospirillales bacterium]